MHVLYKLRLVEVTAGVWQISDPLQSLNVYWADGVLFDAATRWHRGAIFRTLANRHVQVVTLTHCHPDHQGVVGAVCRRFAAELACHEDDAAAMEGQAPMSPLNGLGWLGNWMIAGTPHPVARRLQDGDTIHEFRVIHAPGHTPGHVIYFRDRDRVAIAGDVLAHRHVITGKVHLIEPPSIFSADKMQNRRSMRLLADLRPSVVCFGHGPPLRDPDELERFIACLERSSRAEASW
jgi:glyoxylase-like metal-dependent hydrolase (beta-lactamase superfamily II)